MTNLPNSIIVPQIIVWWNIIKSQKTYDVSQWTKNSLTRNLSKHAPHNWAEAEWFVIDSEWNPYVFDNDWFIQVWQNNNLNIRDISTCPVSEENINMQIRNFSKDWIFGSGIWTITQELYMLTIELSLDQGYSTDELFTILVKSFYEIIGYLNTHWLEYLPCGNLPINTPNIPNLSNEYYKYLFEQRDGWRIWDFRWAAFQIHRYAENYPLSIFIFNKIRHVLPLFLGLSANSPFAGWKYLWNVSERTDSKFSWKMTWIPNPINNQFLVQLQKWINTNIKSVTPYYFAVRYPRVDIKTIENCSMDMVWDIALMFCLVDINYRFTQKLKAIYLEAQDNWIDPSSLLPSSLFGDEVEESSIWTNILQTNFIDTIRYWTRGELSVLWRWKIPFKKFMYEFLEFIDEIPSIIPSFVSKSFDLKNTDFTNSIVRWIFQNWNPAEIALNDFWLLTADVSNPIQLNYKDLTDYMVSMSINFKRQIFSLLTQIKNEENMTDSSL